MHAAGLEDDVVEEDVVEDNPAAIDQRALLIGDVADLPFLNVNGSPPFSNNAPSEPPSIAICASTLIPSKIRFGERKWICRTALPG